MNIFVLPACLYKQKAAAYVLRKRRVLEIINQQTLFNIRAYSESSKNKKIVRKFTCVLNHYTVELKKVMP